MKKSIAVGLMVVLAVILSGCGGDAEETPTPAETPAATPTPAETPTVAPTPSPTPTPPPTPTPLPALIGYTAHFVGENETLERIAERYGSLIPAIASLNRFPLDAPIGAGQALVIPLFANQGITETIEVKGLEVSRGLPGRRIALTFDAGADSDPAVSILDTLKDYDIQVTFFLTGKWAEENPELVQRMAIEGHEIANHTYSHPRLTSLEDEDIIEEVLRAERIIRDLVGQTTRPFLRPPYGDRNRRVLDLLAREGYISIYWTVDSLDSVGDPKTAEFLLERVTNPVDGRGEEISLEGAIILMHVGNATSAEALPAILDRLQERGYAVVRLSEILRP